MNGMEPEEATPPAATKPVPVPPLTLAEQQRLELIRKVAHDAAMKTASTMKEKMTQMEKRYRSKIVQHEKYISELKGRLSKETIFSWIGEAYLQKDKEEDPEEDAKILEIKSKQDRWKARYQQLVRYRMKHGNCDVPLSKNKSLHAWVRKQRIDKANMDQMFIDALDAICFSWFIGRCTKDDVWEQNYQALVLFQSANGHCRVPKSHSKQLNKWVENQRARRKLLETRGPGKAKGMTMERVEKLDAIGFVWTANK